MALSTYEIRGVLPPAPNIGIEREQVVRAAHIVRDAEDVAFNGVAPKVRCPVGERTRDLHKAVCVARGCLHDVVRAEQAQIVCPCGEPHTGRSARFRAGITGAALDSVEAYRGAGRLNVRGRRRTPSASEK